MDSLADGQSPEPRNGKRASGLPVEPARISAGQARRIALAAQGFGRAHPAKPNTRALAGMIDRIALLQLDSVNVFERSHYLPAFSRLGAYDKGALDRLIFTGDSASGAGARPAVPKTTSGYVEYWAHEAAVIPLTSWPLFRWRMDAMRARYGPDASGWVASNAPMLQWLREELAARGPLMASEIEHETGKGAGGWWGWSDVKTGLEYLFRFGEVVSAGRTRFERRYALAEAAIPAEIHGRSVSQEDAIHELLSISAKAHGIGTLADFADYFRIKNVPALAAIRDLVDAGELLPVTVDGWNTGGRAREAWIHRDARIPRKIQATALLSPFDPVVWERARAERMFAFHYRIEIYTPAPQRVFGYYSLPLLIDDRLVGRVDLKNDRTAKILRVQAAWTEPDAPTDTAARLAILLSETAVWQGLERVEVTGRGNLAGAVAAELTHGP